jgi:ubiquinone/menaquinone biosynthesis C-methylase UbiE
MDAVIKHYEDYDEDNRLIRGKAQQIEFLTTVREIEALISPDSKILEIGAGTGRYSFYFAERGNSVTAVDITPKHIEIMKEKLSKYDKSIEISIELGDGRNLTGIESQSFDVALCFGPLYHLIRLEDRLKCVEECLRVLKKGGILAIAYVNRYFVMPYVIKQDK